MIYTRIGARLLGSACIVLASGCSPYLYKKEIQEFDQHTKALAAALDDAETATAKDYWQLIGFQNRNDDKLVRLHKDCVDQADQAKSVTETFVAGESFKCRLVEVDPSTHAETDLNIDPFPEGFARADKIIKALNEYTKALLAITNAEDRKALDAASHNFCKAVDTLGTLAPAPGAGPAAGAVCNALASAYAARLDQRRYEVLRAGVVKADPVVKDLTAHLEELLRAARNTRIESITTVANAAHESLDHGLQASRAPDRGGPVYTDSYWVPLNQVFVSAQDLEQLLTLDPAAVVKSFQQAHTALATAVESGAGQTDAIFQSLGKLSEDIQAVRKAFKPAAG